MALRRRNPSEPNGHRFQMKEKLISIGDDYWMEDDVGQRTFRVNGKAARIRDTCVLEDAHGHEVAPIRERKLSVRDSITIEFDGRKATVKKAMLGGPRRARLDVETVTKSERPKSRRSGYGRATPTAST